MEKPNASDLQVVRLFQGLSADDHRVLAEWLDVEEHERGYQLLRNRDHGYAFYILVSGLAHAELDGTLLEVLEPGAVFGEMAFFYPDSRRTATVVADTPVRVFAMFGTRFREMEVKLPEVAARLRSLLDERARREAAVHKPA